MKKYKIKINFETEREGNNEDEALESFWEDIESTPQQTIATWVGDLIEVEEMGKTKTLCFNKERIKDLKDKWLQYNMNWDNYKNNIPKELYEIIEEIIERLEK